MWTKCDTALHMASQHSKKHLRRLMITEFSGGYHRKTSTGGSGAAMVRSVETKQNNSSLDSNNVTATHC